MGTRRRNLFLGSDQAARSPLLLADLPEKALSGGFRGPIATRVNKPENDDPSIVEPIELTNPACAFSNMRGTERH
jgi:hypothetical protein